MSAINLSKETFRISLVLVILILLVWLLKEFNLYKVDVDKEGAKVTINFILPMDKNSINENILVVTDNPESKFNCKVSWKSKSTAVIEVQEEDLVKGQAVKLSVNKAKTMIPFIRKNATVAIKFKTTPKVLSTSNTENLTANSSIFVQFNTPMKSTNINEYIESDTSFNVKPVEGTNNSKWELKPRGNLKSDSKHLICIKKGMKAICGLTLEEDTIIEFNTVSKPKVVSLTPENGKRNVGIFPVIKLQASEAIESAILTIDNRTTEGLVSGTNKAEFLLPNVLSFDSIYDVVLQVTSKHGEKSDKVRFSFKTIPLDPDKLWVKVILKDQHKMKVYKGNKLVKTMICSGGTKEDPTILGTYFLKDRGPMFFAHKISEGANNWVRINGNYLVHGIPRDKDWNIQQEALDKLGTAASHGCIRLSEEDAQWFYDTIPEGTMIIIHK